MTLRPLVREVEDEIARTRKNRKRKTADGEAFGQNIGTRIRGDRNTLANSVSDLKDEPEWLKSGVASNVRELMPADEPFSEELDESDVDYFAKKDAACISSHGSGYQWDEELGACSVSQ